MHPTFFQEPEQAVLPSVLDQLSCVTSWGIANARSIIACCSVASTALTSTTKEGRSTNKTQKLFKNNTEAIGLVMFNRINKGKKK
jgi:hypothetical protein